MFCKKKQKSVSLNGTLSFFWEINFDVYCKKEREKSISYFYCCCDCCTFSPAIFLKQVDTLNWKVAIVRIYMERMDTWKVNQCNFKVLNVKLRPEKGKLYPNLFKTGPNSLLAGGSDVEIFKNTDELTSMPQIEYQKTTQKSFDISRWKETKSELQKSGLKSNP